jgi:hypothetical protein
VKSDPNTQRVNAAVGVAVRRAITEMPSIGNRQALELSIGRRLQGAYGAQLRRLADDNPDLSIAELAEAVIFAAEYPDDIPEASVYTGDRDRARQSRPKAPSPADDWPDGKLEDVPGWREGLPAAKAGVTDVMVIAPPPELIANPEHVQHVGGLRNALRTGTESYGQRRRARLDGAQ